MYQKLAFCNIICNLGSVYRCFRNKGWSLSSDNFKIRNSVCYECFTKYVTPRFCTPIYFATTPLKYDFFANAEVLEKEIVNLPLCFPSTQTLNCRH